MTIITKKLDNYTFIETEDGSFTVHSNTYNEACHSTSGARSETILHYIKGCKIIERSKTAALFPILEVGFGIGLGFLETYRALKENAITSKIQFVSLEIDPALVEYVKETTPLLQGLIKKGNTYFLKIENIELYILIGDARITLKNFEAVTNFQAIYQDAFSPKRNTALWTKEWFELLAERAHPECIMSTYSSSSSIRKSMLAAGWKIQKGDKFGPKRSSTRAYKSGESDKEILEHLERSPAPVLTDENKNEYGVN